MAPASLTASPLMTESATVRRAMTLNIQQGLHIRACSAVVAITTDFRGTVRIEYRDRSADASSMFDLIQLAVLPGDDVVVEATGPDAERVVDKIHELFSMSALA